MTIVVTSSSSSANPALEQFVLDGLALNDHTNFIMQGFDVGIPPKRWQWISGTDSDGAVLPEEAHYDNAEMTLRIRIAPQSSMDNALAQIGSIVDKLQECEQQPLGLPAVWTPAGATKSLTAYIVGGEVTGIPLALSGGDAGWFLRNPAPVVTIKLYRRPGLYGTEVTSAVTLTNSDPVQIFTVSGVTGDLLAEGRLVATDAATQSRRHLEWGRAWRYTPPSALIDSDSLVTTGFAGTQTTRTGAYDNPAAGNNVIRGTLSTTPIAVCGTGNLGHIGTFRVKARVYPVIGTAIASDLKIRLSWKEGDGPLRSNAYTYPVAGTAAFSEVDLGMVSIPEKTLGTQRWTGQIEAYSTTGGDTLDVDYIVLIPAEGYGKARAPITLTTPTTFSARDEFDQSAGNLTGKVAPTGGTYVVLTGSDTDDFTIDTTGHTAQRTAVSDTGSGAVGGARAVGLDLNLSATAAQFDWKASVDRQASRGFLVRVVDASNFFSIGITGGTTNNLVLASYIGGTLATAKFFTVPLGSFTSWQTLAVLIDTAGRYYIWMAPQGAPLTLVASGSDTVLATGGALATGDVYLMDTQSGATAVTRNYDNFFVWVPTVDAVVFSGRAAEIRHDQAIRQDSTGTYYGPVDSYRGARFFLHPAGDENRVNTIVGKARRNDIDMGADDSIADSTTWTVHYTPKYLVAPR